MVCPLPIPAAMATRTILLIILLATAGGLLAQKGGRVEILNADSWEFDESIPGAQRLKGNVRFRHAGAIMTCDSAYLYDDQRVEAFGKVRINQGDTLYVEGRRLDYNSRDRQARMDGDVVLRNKDMELSTPSLLHDMQAGRSIYEEGGRLVSLTDSNTLVSRRGTYISDQRLFIFSKRVRVYHPERIIRSDTMHYSTHTGIARFFGPSTITMLKDSSVITTRRGTYDTQNELARFTRRSSISSKKGLMEGDSLHYDRNTGIGLAWGNVVVSDTASGMVARGAFGRHDDQRERSMITGRAEMQLRMGADTLYLHADTLLTRTIEATDSLGHTRTGKRIKAFHGVRFFKEDMQGVCDTLVYNELDSLIRMFHLPAIWSGQDQITGDHIRILLRDGKADRLYVENNAFLMSEVDSVNFDQVTGIHMTGFFADEELRRLLVEGNARTVYFAREEKNGETEYIGMNRADCSRLTVLMEDGQISTVTFLDRPDAILYPMGKIPPEEKRMKGALWRIEERPMDRKDIFRKVAMTVEEEAKAAP
jgi:lipopolysaccharide export system protein LptA